MAAPDLSKYMGEAGTKILHHEYELRDLGLALDKSRLGTLSQPGGLGGTLEVWDFNQFKKRDERFSQQLVDFLRDKIGLAPERVARLELEAVLSPEEF